MAAIVGVVIFFKMSTMLILIPVLTGIVWIIYNALIYNREMEEMAEEAAPEFSIVEKDELQYVVVKPRSMV
jgi:hypothetical protein